MGVGTNLRAKEEEHKGDGTASQTDKSKQRTRPLISEPLVHLIREQHHCCTPERSDEGLGGESGRRLVLVRVYQVVIRAVIQEDEPESHRKAANRWTYPVHFGVAGPGEDEQADGDEPARQHHGIQASFGRRLAIVLMNERHVVLVHERRAGSTQQDTDDQGDEHQARGAGRIALALLVHNRVRDEEHVQQTVEHRHVQRDEEDDEFAEEELERADQEQREPLAERTRVDVLLRHVLGVACFLAHLGCAAGEQRRCVGLGHGEGD